MVEREIERDLKDIVLRLFARRGISISKIVIFGSFVRGDEGEGSDVDIIVISPSFNDMDIFERLDNASGIHRALVERLRRPVDILYYSDLEWGRESSLMIQTAKDEGEVIYESSGL